MKRSVVAAAVAILGLAASVGGPVASAGASGPPPDTTSKPIGYVYTTTGSDILILAVQKDYSLRLVAEQPTATSNNTGLALLHEPGGIFLYDVSNGYLATYSVTASTGRLKLVSTPTVGPLLTFFANDLITYDGYATNHNDVSEFFGTGCSESPCLAGVHGFTMYRPNPTTGAPKQIGLIGSATADESIDGNQIDLLAPGSVPHQAEIVPLEIKPTTGALIPGHTFNLTYGSEQIPASANAVGTGPDWAAVAPMNISATGFGVSAYPSSGTNITAGSDTPIDDGIGVTELVYTKNHLVAGEVASGPQIQYFPKDANGTGPEGTIDLTQPPYDYPVDVSDNATVSLTLGDGVYMGWLKGPVLQATDGYQGKGFTINKTSPTVAGTGGTYGLAGYLIPKKTATKTTLTLNKHAGKVKASGKVTGGVAGVKVDVKLERHSGGAWKLITKKSPSLSSGHTYKASLKRAKAGTCRAVASYPGNATTKASSATKKFSC